MNWRKKTEKKTHRRIMGREHKLVERTVRGKRREFPAELVAGAKKRFFFFKWKAKIIKISGEKCGTEHNTI